MGEASPIIFLSYFFFFAPNLFFTHVLIVGGARRWISVFWSEECGRNSSSIWLIVTTNPVLLGNSYLVRLTGTVGSCLLIYQMINACMG